MFWPSDFKDTDEDICFVFIPALSRQKRGAFDPRFGYFVGKPGPRGIHISVSMWS